MTQLYFKEDSTHSEARYVSKVTVNTARDGLLDLLSDDVVMRRSGGAGGARELAGKRAVAAATLSAQASPLSRSTWLRGYWECGGAGATWAVAEGEITYILDDHDAARVDACASRRSVAVPFCAHFALIGGKVARRHTVCDMGPVTRLLRSVAHQLRPLEMRLYAGAAHGRIGCGEVPALLDSAALLGADDDMVIDGACGAPVVAAEWEFDTGL